MFDGDLEGEIEPVITEKYEIECGDESKSLVFLGSSENRKSEAWIKTIFLKNKNYCQNFNFSIEILLEDLKWTVIDKYSIKYRHKSTK